MADMKVSSRKRDTLATFALGSCLGITVWNPLKHVGGMVHIMLPYANRGADRPPPEPAHYLDTGLPALLAACREVGGSHDRFVLKAAGGAAPNLSATRGDHFQIGQRNIEAMHLLLAKLGLRLAGSDLGGSESRNMALEVGTGRVRVWGNAGNRDL